MKATFGRLRLFLLTHLVVLLGSGIVILLTDKKTLHLSLNTFHHPFLDVFFKYATHMAEGLVIGFMVFIVLIYKIRYAAAGLVGVVVSGLTTQFLKRVVFNDHFRPTKVFEGLADLHLIEGVRLHKAFSFPSGHATAAFALFLFLAYVVNSKKLKVLCYLLAVITAYSRVYLSQHFFEDIVVGSIVGSTICFLSLWLINQPQWGEKGLLEGFEINRKRP